MASPISFLFEHERLILQTYTQNNAKPAATWQCLEKTLPQLSQTMTFNTFKQYVSVFVSVKSRLDEVRQNEKHRLERKLDNAMGRLDKVRRQKKRIIARLRKVQARKKQIKTELDKVRQSKPDDTEKQQKLDSVPKRICGWNVQHSKDGYYRCYRKIEKRLYSIYLGKNPDMEKSRARIRAKEKELV